MLRTVYLVAQRKCPRRPCVRFSRLKDEHSRHAVARGAGLVIKHWARPGVFSPNPRPGPILAPSGVTYLTYLAAVC